MHRSLPLYGSTMFLQRLLDVKYDSLAVSGCCVTSLRVMLEQFPEVIWPFDGCCLDSLLTVVAACPDSESFLGQFSGVA